MSPLKHLALVDIPAMLDKLPVGIAMISPSGRLKHFNRALEKLLGIEAEKAAGMPCRNVLRTRLCVSGCPLGCSAFSAGKESFTPPGGVESDLINFKRRRLPVRLRHFSLPDERGGELMRLDVLEDLTMLKELEQRLARPGGGRLIGRSPAMERIFAQLPLFAAADAPVLLTGETGTGKDLLAECLHHDSPRAREPFVRLNAGPMPEDLFIAELFGEAAEGRAGKAGRFRQAAEGSLYISELADLPAACQARLVRFLDDGSILPLHAEREVRLNVRLIAATGHAPEDLVREGRLSAELFHRLNVIRLHLPPLRERGEDLDFLLQHFLEMYAARFKKRAAGFDAGARRLLAAHSYPGNIRELRNIIEYAAMVAPEGLIGVEHLPVHIAAEAPAMAKTPRAKAGKARNGA